MYGEISLFFLKMNVCQMWLVKEMGKDGYGLLIINAFLIECIYILLIMNFNDKFIHLFFQLGHLVSSKKEELIYILDHFNIQVFSKDFLISQNIANKTV